MTNDKKTLLYAIGAVFFFVIGFAIFAKIALGATAEIPTTPYVLGTSSSDFFTWGRQQSLGITNNKFEIKQDSNGYYYWQATSTSNTIQVGTTTSANPTISLASESTGWKAYAIYEKSGGSINRFRHGGAFSSGAGTVISTFSVDGKTLSLIDFGGLTSTSSATLSSVYIDTPQLSAGQRLYLVTYTTDDLSYINSQEELYDYIDSFSSGTPTGGNSTRLLQTITPLSNALEPDTNVTFSFEYWFNDTETPNLTHVGGEVRNITDQIVYPLPEQAITSSGESTFTTTMTLAQEKLYLWRPYIRGEGETTIYGSWQSFDVVNFSGDIELIPTEFGSATSSIASNIANRFLGQQSALAQKFPFVYFYDIANILGAVSDTETENNFPVLAIDMASSGLPMGTMILFSTSTVSEFAGSSNVSIFRSLMGAVLWLGFASMVFFTIKGLFKH